MAYALITGASSGIGYEMAKIFAEKGIDVVLVARSGSKLKNLSEMLMNKHHIKSKVLSIDLSQPHAAKHIYDDVNGDGIEVDYLVNNAGFGDYGKFAESDWEKEQTMINLNINAVTHLTRLFLPDMVKRNRGRILNLGSTGSFQPCPLMAVYCASKAYILSFTEALANELNGTKVTVTALCPGATRSGFQDKAEMEGSNLIKGKLASPNEVALFGYKAMMKGKTIAVHGFKNRLLAGSVRFFPRKLVANIARKMMER